MDDRFVVEPLPGSEWWRIRDNSRVGTWVDAETWVTVFGDRPWLETDAIRLGALGQLWYADETIARVWASQLLDVTA